MTKWITLLQNNDYIGVKQHIKEGADINDHNENDESVLALAIKYKCDDELIDLLIDNGADLEDFDNEGVSIFDYAITYNNIPLVQKMIADGTDVNQTSRRSRFTPLMAAVCYGRVELVSILLANGADKNAMDAQGFTAVSFAEKMRKQSMLKMLDSN
ncbi:MAG: ankyrin repeat domain-containing protein [Campylobacterota bacterium]|nr:ankyrin repeat domain-containing protein [Campylobacterota bacterium]